MPEPSFLDDGLVAKHDLTAWAPAAEGHGRRSLDRCRSEHRWLRNRVDSLETQLRLRNLLLAGTLTLSAFVWSLFAIAFYGPELPTVALAVAPESSPRVMWKGLGPLQIERSRDWANGEEQIEAIAALHFDAETVQAPAEELTTIRQEAGRREEMKPRPSAGEIARDQRGQASTPGRPFVPPSQSRAAQGDEGAHYTAKDFVNLRAAPDNSAHVLAVVAQGELVRQTGHDLGWLQVDYGDGNASSIRGWVYGSYLRRVETSGGPARP
jgi:Bacterial SH3 domain